MRMRYGLQMLRARGLQSPLRGPYDLDVESGTIVGISGASGSGKTLLLRMLADLDPSTGEVTLAGRNRDGVPAPKWRSWVTYVAAEPAFWADSVREHFATGADVEERFRELGLDVALLDAPVTSLSTGERQRVALVRALVQSPRILLLDEPTSGLDAVSATRVEDVLSRYVANGMGLLVVSHDEQQLRRLGARVLRMNAQGALETT